MQEKALIQDFLRKHGNVNGRDRVQLITLVQAVARIPWGEGRTIEEVLHTKHVGTCTGKHLVLGACFDLLGIPHRTSVCTFRWSEQKLKLPKECLEILSEGEWIHGHNFLQIQNAMGNWIDVDVTWDPPLHPHGFRAFPEGWDGATSFIGLNPLIERIDNADLRMKQKWLETLTEEQQERRKRFLAKLFAWVASLRDGAKT